MKAGRLLIVAGALGALVLTGRSASAGSWTPLEFRTVVPCAAACPYWMDTTNRDVDNDGEEDVAFNACANPGGTGGSLAGVPGLPWQDGIGFDDIVVGPRPDGTSLLIVEIYPTVDWDLFICGTNGADVTPCSGREECSILGGNCDNHLGPQNPVLVGCDERLILQTTSDRSYVLRAYNFADPFPLSGRYCWSASGQC